MSEKEDIARLEKVVYGDGANGLCDRMTIVEQIAKDVKGDIKSLSTSYSALAKSMLEYDIIERLKAENVKAKTELKERYRKSAVLIISIIAIATPITALIISLKP